MSEQLSTLPPHSIDPSNMAVFLDFDGTLVEIAERPEQVVVAPATRRMMERLSVALSGAVAVVTGRNISDIDSFLAPLHLPVAGVHGLERRSHGGTMRRIPVNAVHLETVANRLDALIVGNKGLLLERKRSSLALHYRARPELEDACVKAVDDATADLSGIHILRGKMVIEAKAGSSNKGDAIGEFLGEPPFAGRVPLFAGDDVTDEDAFAAVNRRGGISIKVGPGATSAKYRVETIVDFLGWLETITDNLERANGA
ncbi:MAG: trehalose-phosphatase [Flavobacteriaceae bacterium]